MSSSAASTTHHDAVHEHSPSRATYIVIFVILLALLVLSVSLAYFIRIPEESPLRDLLTLAAYVIASAKALLIILWFMHVKQGTRLTWLFAGAAFFWLGIMIYFTMGDYLSRDVNYFGAPSAMKMPPQLPPAGAAQEGRPPRQTPTDPH